MHPVLKHNLYFVKEHAGIFKAANNFDIFDPETNELLIECREEQLGMFAKMLRFTKYKKMTPFNIILRSNGETIMTIRRGVSIFLSNVEVYDENAVLAGHFKQKFFSIGGKFDILDSMDNVLCTLKGKWTSWDFRFMKEDTELASVTKKWAGISKELFTSADNYVLKIDEHVAHSDPTRVLIVAAVMCIDMVLKE
jgi:uncharacterized protein YxjI